MIHATDPRVLIQQQIESLLGRGPGMMSQMPSAPQEPNGGLLGYRGLPPAPRKPGFMERLLPVPKGMEGLLSPEDLKQARKMAMMRFGVGLLEGSAPQNNRTPGLGQALARGVMSGMQGYGEATQSAAQGAMFARGEQEKVRLQEVRAKIGERLRSAKTPAERHMAAQEMLNAALQANDLETAKTVLGMLQVMPRENAQNGKIEEIAGADGKPAFGYVTPEGVRQIPGAGPLTRPGSEPAKRLVSVTNPTTGKPELAEYDPRTGGFRLTGRTPAASRDAAATEGERKGAVLMQMVNNASPILDAADAPNRIEQLAQGLGTREFINQNQQIFNQAGLVIADAYIRLTSGANAPEPEVRRTMQMITPQPGDKPALLARKRATRQAFVRALNIAAGRAAAQVETPAAAPDPTAGTAAEVDRW